MSRPLPSVSVSVCRPAARSPRGALLPMAAAAATVLALLAGCARFPEVDRFPPATGGAAAPALLPLDDLLSQAAVASAGGTQAAGEALAARAARLKARAALMRGPVLDPATRARLAAAIAGGRA